jgi:hypothetical protein
MNTSLFGAGQARGRWDDDGGHEPGERVLRSGKYKGRRLKDCPEAYLRGLLNLPELNEGLRDDIELLIDVDQPEGDDDGRDPHPGSAAVRFPLVCWQWEADMAAAYRGDEVGLAVVRAGSGRLRELCSEVTGRPWPAGQEGGAA